jgi:hypothetical protein
VREDCRPREQVENHGRVYLVPSAGQKIPVQPGWYLPPQKILLAENRFLQTRKGAENTKEKSRQCFTVGVQLLRLKVHSSADSVHLPTRYALIRNCAEFGHETRMFDRETLLIYRKPFLPWAVHVHCLLMHMPIEEIHSCIHSLFLSLLKFRNPPFPALLK